MPLLKNLSIGEFLEKTASKNPVPGGGSVAALGAALAASLAEMVATLTIGKPGYGHAEAEMTAVAAAAENYRKTLLKDIDRDSDAFNAVMAAFRLPKDSAEEKEARKRAIADAFKTAATVPLEVAKTGYAVMALAEKAVREGNRNAVTDALVAVMMARTAVLSALLNVRINLNSIEDGDFVAAVAEQIKTLEADAENREKEIRSQIAV
jgi:formiminotetrahydrofolate cyclodeaminase